MFVLRLITYLWFKHVIIDSKSSPCNATRWPLPYLDNQWPTGGEAMHGHGLVFTVQYCSDLVRILQGLCKNFPHNCVAYNAQSWAWNFEKGSRNNCLLGSWMHLFLAQYLLRLPSRNTVYHGACARDALGNAEHMTYISYSYLKIY